MSLTWAIDIVFTDIRRLAYPDSAAWVAIYAYARHITKSTHHALGGKVDIEVAVPFSY